MGYTVTAHMTDGSTTTTTGFASYESAETFGNSLVSSGQAISYSVKADASNPPINKDQE